MLEGVLKQPKKLSFSVKMIRPMSDYITIKGAREHNLKNVDLEIPRGKLVVITGLSGSGSLRLRLIRNTHAEGQRRYVESLSSYARQFLGVMEAGCGSNRWFEPSRSIDQS